MRGVEVSAVPTWAGCTGKTDSFFCGFWVFWGFFGVFMSFLGSSSWWHEIPELCGAVVFFHFMLAGLRRKLVSVFVLAGLITNRIVLLQGTPPSVTFGVNWLLVPRSQIHLLATKSNGDHPTGPCLPAALFFSALAASFSTFFCSLARARLAPLFLGSGLIAVTDPGVGGNSAGKAMRFSGVGMLFGPNCHVAPGSACEIVKILTR